MKLILNAPVFEYDIRGLLMAFYPWQKFVTDEEAEDVQCLRVTYEGAYGLIRGMGNVPVVLKCTLELTDEKKAPDGERSPVHLERCLQLDFSDKKAAKSLLKRTLYAMLSEVNGHGLPWGTLTGIRPTKIPMDMLVKGRPEDEIRAHLATDLLVSDEKASLSIDIAKRELKLLQGIDAKDGWSLYVGIPFCPTTCLYCSFTSYPIHAYRDRVEDYLKAVFRELDWIRENFAGKPLNAVYFGGGTPTSVSADQLDRLLQKVEDSFDLSHCLEWTVEAGRPDSVTEEKLLAIRKHPVTRISVNPQTMHQETLDLIGRRHTVEDVLRVYRTARRLGFDNINMDLILGLPGETPEMVRETLEKVVSLDPDNVTVHSLAIKRAARLNLEKAFYGHYRMENTTEAMDLCREMLGTIGLSPYYLYRQKNMAGNLENVGYAKEGKEGVYNILIMEEIQSIAAAGAGATTKRVNGSLITRAENVKNVDQYIENVDEMIERKKELFQ